MPFAENLPPKLVHVFGGDFALFSVFWCSGVFLFIFLRKKAFAGCVAGIPGMFVACSWPMRDVRPSARIPVEFFPTAAIKPPVSFCLLAHLYSLCVVHVFVYWVWVCRPRPLATLRDKMLCRYAHQSKVPF